MAEKKLSHWLVQVYWEDGTDEQIYPVTLPDSVSAEIKTHIQLLQDYLNNGWDDAYDTGWERDEESE